MQKFDFYCPTKIVFGAGREVETGAQVAAFGGKKALIIFGGQSALKSGLIDRVEASLRKAGVESLRLGGVHPNPLLSLAEEGVRMCIEHGVDFLVAVGGGSTIDTAKGIAIGAANPGLNLWDVWTKGAAYDEVLPIGVVLTISAAGSETSDSVVLTNDEDMMKRGHNSDKIRPRFAIMNPELTYTLPMYQVTCGIVDIMMHTLERYFNPITNNELTDEIAEGLLRTVLKAGRAAYADKTDYQAMSELMWAGSLSHNNLTGLGGGKDFASHQLGMALGGMYDSAHGATLSAVWCSWARYCLDTDPERFARLGRKVFGLATEALPAREAGLQAIAAMEDFFRSLAMPTCLSELGVGVQTDEQLHTLAHRCSYFGTRTIGQFRKLDEEDIYNIFVMTNR